jgi:mono/diheme cytochrome c family protein
MNIRRSWRLPLACSAWAVAVLAGLAFVAQPGSAALAAAPAAAAASGAQVYGRWCVHCHATGRGNPGTQSLQVKYGGRVPAVLLERTDLTAEAVAVFVRQGVQSMPPFRKTEITDAELAALSAWVASGGGKR